jgi:hypothetical protein
MMISFSSAYCKKKFPYLASTTFTHKRSHFTRSNESGDIVQKSPLLATADINIVVQVVPREHGIGLDELALGSVSLGLLLFGDIVGRNGALFGIASGCGRVERRNLGILLKDELGNPTRGVSGPFGTGQEPGNKAKPEGNDDTAKQADILVESSSSPDSISLQVSPQVLVVVVVRGSSKGVSIDERLTRNGADSGADLVLNACTFIARARGHKVRTFTLQAMELVNNEGLEAIANGVDICEPFQGTDPIAQ